MAQAHYSPKSISNSEFAMWRAVFAFTLVDQSLSLEEQEVLRSYLKTVPFSTAQRATLKNDFLRPQNVEAMYKKITDTEHKKRFCVLARALAWCEGDMDRQEERILRHVGCLAHGQDNDYFRASRDSPDLQDYYKRYAAAGVVGLMRGGPGFQMHV